MKKIVVATNNKHKAEEMAAILKDFEVLTLSDVGFTEEIEENGSTFEENAVIKARTVCDRLGVMTLADDSGLEIDALNKEPGIYSARYLGHDTPYDKKNGIILERMKGVEGENRSARFICAIAIAYPDGRTTVVKKAWEGRIAEEAAGCSGFGYDPIFYVPDEGMTAAELPQERKNAVSHRAMALHAVQEELSD